MNKKLIILCILSVLTIVCCGCASLIFAGPHPDSDDEIKTASMQYLKEKYNEDFEFQKEDAACNEGNGWVYSVYATPKNNPGIQVYVRSSPGLKDMSDDYAVEVWSKDRETEVKKVMKSKFKGIQNFRNSLVVKKEVQDKYKPEDNILDIVKKEERTEHTDRDEPVSEIVQFDVNLGDNGKLNEEKICEDSVYIINYYKKLELDFMLIVNYKDSNGGIARLDLNSNVKADTNNIKRFITKFKQK